MGLTKCPVVCNLMIDTHEINIVGASIMLASACHAADSTRHDRGRRRCWGGAAVIAPRPPGPVAAAAAAAAGRGPPPGAARSRPPRCRSRPRRVPRSSGTPAPWRSAGAWSAPRPPLHGCLAAGGGGSSSRISSGSSTLRIHCYAWLSRVRGGGSRRDQQQRQQEDQEEQQQQHQ